MTHTPRQGSVLTVTEAASRLQVSPSTVYRWVHDGTLPALRYGAQWSRGQRGRGGAIRIPETEITIRLPL